MHFVTWLWEQQEDSEGVIANFAKTCWNDVNNGCAHAKFSPTQWLEHFNSKHKESSELLSELLLRAYAQYLREVKGKFAL